MASRCPREKGNISLAGPANNPGNRTITRSPCECAHQPTPLFIDTFRAKTTDIAKREPITKSRLSLSYHAETFSPRVPLILVPFFFFLFAFLLLFYHFCLPENARIPSYHLPDGQWIHLFANAKAEGKMDDREAWLSRSLEEYMDHRQNEKNIRGWIIFLFLFRLSSILNFSIFESLKINLLEMYFFFLFKERKYRMFESKILKIFFEKTRDFYENDRWNVRNKNKMD